MRHGNPHCFRSCTFWQDSNKAPLRHIFAVLYLLLVCLQAGSVYAQGIAPLRIEPDPSGLDLLGGKVETGGPVLSVPAAPRLTYTSIRDQH